jgi:hypothetical protein
MELMKEDLIFVITFGFYMKKQAERKMHLGTPKASYRALVCRETLVGVAAHKSRKLTDGSYAITSLGDNHL